MKVAYISGPYTAPTFRSVIQNILAAAKVAEAYWAGGYAVLCPHLNTSLMDTTIAKEVFILGDLEFVRRSDVVVMLPGWEKSEGACQEYHEALRCKKEINFVEETKTETTK
jgi:hypothetical protein